MNAQQLAARTRLVGVGQQRLAVLLLRNVGRALEQRVERAVGGNQIAGALFADAGHALHVVDRVAHQREHVHDLLRRDAELLFHAGGVVPRAFVARVEHADAVPHELKEVLVARDDRDAVGLGCRPLGDRADHIVGFVALVGENRDAERLAGAMDPRNLLGEIGRHGRAVGFVVGGELGAERRTGEIERRRDELRPLVVEQLAEHRDEPVHGVGGSSVGTGETADRVIGAYI